jgi:signal transduction histidine kinase
MSGLRAELLSGTEAIPADEAVGVRMVALMRCLLALSALLLFLADPMQAGRPSQIVLASLAAYGVYSIALAAVLFDGRSFVPSRLQPWLDMLFYACLVWLAGAAGTVFFAFVFFAIAAASFSRGVAEGLALTLVAGFLLTVAGLVVQPVLLVLLGGMIAWWGGHQLCVTQRLRLLKDLLGLPNSRFGVDHALAQYLGRLRAYFEADACVLVCARAGASDYIMYRVDASQSASHGPQPLSERSAQALLARPADESLVWDVRQRRDRPHAGLGKDVANLLETSCFATVPYVHPSALTGRLYVAGNRRRFGRSALELLRQAAAQIAASVDKMALLDELMAQAAQGERSRISLDIHDTTIQPYIGLKLALEALQRSLDARSSVAAQVGELVDMCSLALEDLRGYVARLRGNGRDCAGDELLSALRQQAGRYRRFYGLEVDVRSDPSVNLVNRVAADAYQIACEGLSNVYRHTRARRAFIDVRCSDRWLALEIGNDRDPARPAAQFMPRSIADRAAALGGVAEVRLNNAGHDVVRVILPL